MRCKNQLEELKEANAQNSLWAQNTDAKKVRLKMFVQILFSVFLARGSSVTAAPLIISVCKSVMSIQEQGLLSVCVCVCVCVCSFLCTSRSILSAADAQTMGGWEEGNCVCVCVVCCDSLQRKLDMCWITRDLEDGWLVEVGAMTSSTQTHGHQIYQILNIQRH